MSRLLFTVNDTDVETLADLGEPLPKDADDELVQEHLGYLAGPENSYQYDKGGRVKPLEF